jgi:predicted dehydrogenase
MKQKLTGIIVGAGHRARLYASYEKECPDEMEIVGVADPSALRRQQVAEEFGLSEHQCFESAEELARVPKFADFVINGTMDHQHVATSLPLLEAGYHMLLEKPFATHEHEMWELVKAARQHQRTIIICHVLRYAPFYTVIRQQVQEGVIGDILNIQATEHVSYHHVAVAYVRGKWNNARYCNTSMLMAKSCHDLDLIAWMKSGVAPRRVTSFGGLFQFTPEKAPEGAGTRCLVDCPIEADCLYSARKHYIDHPDRWAFYVWDSLEHLPNPTIEQKIESLKGDNPYGRCVWQCDNEVVDHQSVLIEFADGCTATLNMIGGCSKPSRSLHLIGTTGEIQGSLEDSKFVIRHIDPRPGHEYREEVVDLNIEGDMTGAFGGHGGGDMRLMADFLNALHGEPRSICSTVIEDSVAGHLIGFGADRSLHEQRVVNIEFEQ